MTTALSVTDAAALRAALLAWFDAAGRDLPWRRRRSLYGTWISEMMLQQTTVAAVAPYWERFLARFPDVATLAAADEAEVLALWSGLGYYRRARLLHAAARRVAVEHGGRLPGDREGWAALPGVGEYAAGAVASIGCGERVPALDANARRVLLRWAVGDPAAAAAVRPAALRALGADLVPADRPGDWNEAVMELGAVVCRARDPRCGACPVARWCRAGGAGTADRVPAPVRREAPVPTAAAMAVVRREDELLLLPPGRGAVLAPDVAAAPVRADLAGLHRGLWGLPTTAWFPAPGDGEAWRDAVLAAARRWAGAAAAGAPAERGRVRHGITRYRLEVTVIGLAVAPGTAAADLAGAGAVWVPADDARPLSKLVRKVVARESHGSG